ncbi:MAG TPA: DUF1223 domain-containing protein [Povalibacter sp.]|uniref:DUF1223 domain-containing protein n=1 Tax=Povalibacter sp. TaxID=1962978 RepID=UPI002B94EC01|nr:DUF1223 domain-containing protein [Povalibacter sp.]HMN44604.1 DUF1223 domain-containing protein [Povalibacter sp.]
MTISAPGFVRFLMLMAAAAFAGPAAARPVVIELFTSQGCSSCPPADMLLGELAKRPDVIALAYHVDYWDDQGWKDRFSIPAAAQRQRGYTRRLSRAGVFTPQAVISGDTSLIGSNRSAMNEALAEKRDTLAIALSKSGSQLVIDLPERWRETLDVHVVSYLEQAVTLPGRGENARRELKEYNIVRSFRSLGRWNGAPQRMKTPLASLPDDATAVAVLLQRPQQGAIAGAATISLRN